MPHASYSSSSALSGPWSGHEGDSPTGPWLPNGSGSVYWQNAAIARPKSTNNPLVGGDRKPASWTAAGGRYETGTSVYELWYLPGAFHKYAYWSGCRVGVPYTVGSIPLVSSSLMDDVVAECLAGITGSSVQFNTSLREAGDTLKMVGNATTGLAKGIDSFCTTNRKKLFSNLKRGMSQWKTIPGRYLEYLYGWRPVLDDVQNAVQQMVGSRSAGYAYRYTIKRTKQVREDYSVDISGLHKGKVRMRSRVTQRCTCSFTFEFPSWFQDELPVISPFGNLWEQSPYTFVADWFLPIGNWVGAMESMQWNPFFKGGSKATALNRVARGCTFIPPTGTSDQCIVGPYGLVNKGSDYKYTRSVISSLASEAFRPPDLRNPLSLDHAAQGLALLTQVLNKWV